LGDRLNLKRWRSLDTALFGLALIAFLATRLIDLDRWPIYFFCDEAINTVDAADFIHDGFRDPEGHLFPTYFPNDQIRSLSVSVYVQVIPYLLFGNSVFATRATSVLIAFSAMIAFGLILKNNFKNRYAWLGILLLSITPVWFLHTRTAFECILWVSFFIWFLYFYLQYRQNRPRHIFGVLLAGALSFYSYNGGQLGIVVGGGLFMLIDWKYHWQVLRQRKRLMLLALLFGVGLSLPYIRFLSQFPLEVSQHLKIVSPAWGTAVPLLDKLSTFTREYLNGLNPIYWYSTANDYDIIRHVMKGYGSILWITLPFALIGLIECLRKIRQPEYRTILIALIVSPLGGALSEATVIHDLLFVVPAAWLTTLGAVKALSLARPRLSYRAFAIGTAAALSIFNFIMLQDAVSNGPLWYDAYGLYGLQYGGSQVFSEVERMLRQSLVSDAIVSPAWANNPVALMRFFTDDDSRVRLGNIDAFIKAKLPLTQNTLFVMTPNEYQRALNDPRFADIHLTQTVKYPNDADGFYFVRLNYSPQADAIFAAEDAARRKPH
jgi:hypothetical protein